MNWYFTFSEFVTLSDAEFGDQLFTPDTSVTDRIIKHYMYALNGIRSTLGIAVAVLSCYRPVWWEEKKGRSGNSQHTFANNTWMGACDITCQSMLSLFALLRCEDYTRIAYYPEQNFFHIDKKTPDKQLFIARPEWEVASEKKVIDAILGR